MTYINLKEGDEHEYYSLSSSRKKTEKVFIVASGETHSLIMHHAYWGVRKVPNEEIFKTQSEARRYFQNYCDPCEFKVGDVVKTTAGVNTSQTCFVVDIKKSKATLKCCETGEIIKKADVNFIVKAPTTEKQ